MSNFRRAQLGVESLEARWLLAADVAGFDAAVVGPMDAGEGEHETIVAEFSLVDVNPNSSTFNQAVSPRDYVGGISGWYFGHST